MSNSEWAYNIICTQLCTIANVVTKDKLLNLAFIVTMATHKHTTPQGQTHTLCNVKPCNKKTHVLLSQQFVLYMLTQHFKRKTHLSTSNVY